MDPGKCAALRPWADAAGRQRRRRRPSADWHNPRATACGAPANTREETNNTQANDCDSRTRTPGNWGQPAAGGKLSCDLSGRLARACLLAATVLLASQLAALRPEARAESIIIDHHRQHGGPHAHTHHSGVHLHAHPLGRANGSLATSEQQQQQQQPPVSGRWAAAGPLAAHFQPASQLAAQNKSVNFTHVAVDELTGTIYLGATNWLFQVNGRDLRVEQALRTGPTTSDSSLARDCAPADCLNQLVPVDLDQLLAQVLHHQHPAGELGVGGGSAGAAQRRLFAGATMHTAAPGANVTSARGAQLPATTTSAGGVQGAAGASSPAPAVHSLQQSQPQPPLQHQQQQHNNYNKLLVIDAESRHLIACGSLNQGACRRHQLGNLANFSELIPLPVASNDEHSSTLGLVVRPAGGGGGAGRALGQAAQQPPPPPPGVLYVAATNSRLGPYREMVPAISARSLDWSSRDRSLQIIERSFTDLARVDISFELRDYYLVNYVHAFQHNDFVYFATVQRKSPLRQLEEWGYATRLGRLCLNDLSFQSYAEMTLECTGASAASGASVNYNLLQDAHLMQAGSQLQAQLGLGARSAVLVGAFAQSRDHTTKSQAKSALCLFPMDKIEQRFQENIELCYNGTIKSRNMNYIAGSVNDCPRNAPSGTRSGLNYCNEPMKLNGSLALAAEPVVSFDQELITSVSATLAPTSPVNIQPQEPQATTTATAAASQRQAQLNSARQHQVLVAGTSEGRLKRLVLVSAGQRVTALEFDSVALNGGGGGGSGEQSAGVLADLQLVPAANPQLSAPQRAHPAERQQFALAATAHKLVKVRVNACKASRAGLSRQPQQPQTGGNSSIVDECLACSQLQDPFCGWCAHSAACTTRDECLQDAFSQPIGVAGGGAHLARGSQQQQQQQHAPLAAAVHWTPFDSIRCSNYQPISPKNVPVQADAALAVDVNVRLNLRHAAGQAHQAHLHHQLAARLAQAQFVCHFDYWALWNRTGAEGAQRSPAPILSGATTKATQARLNLHAGTAAIGCPLPAAGQRPSLAGADSDQARVRLSVRLASLGAAARAEISGGESNGNGGGDGAADDHNEGNQNQDQDARRAPDDRALLEQVLGMRVRGASAARQQADGAGQSTSAAPAEAIERELTLYDCSQNADCRSCLSSGSLGRRWSCAWCPLSSKCTFNASHPDFGCAAGAVASTTPHSATASDGEPAVAIRGSQLTASLDRAQASVLGLTIERLGQCPGASSPAATGAAFQQQQQHQQPADSGDESPVGGGGGGGARDSDQAARAAAGSERILVPNNARRAIQVPLARSVHHFQPRERRVLRLECLLELEGAKARFAARLLDSTLVACQESLFAYQAEVATQRARLSVVLNDNQVIETTEVTIYKCHLFGVNPPALTSSVLAGAAAPSALSHGHHSSAAWTSSLSDFWHLLGASPLGASAQAGARRPQSDCSLCLNIDRKYQCSWCAGQCVHADQCGPELAASTCPPPRIDSIHPTSGPIAGGTLLTIEGSNLGSNEREIQDKILVGGEPCKLIMYSVSTRIVCKTGPSSTGGPQAATVFVGNRAGVTSAHEKFHYKAVHLADVHPRVGPVSGGTRLLLTGSNLNVGSRTQIFLDDIPCPLDSSFDATSQQVACVTGPNLHASGSQHISKLTLAIDGSSHELPFPFAYQPDPIITAIEPAESFLSGGRLILVSGQHLASAQSVKLVVFHESRPSLSNATACVKQNDTLVTCLTPAFSRADLLAVAAGAGAGVHAQQSAELESGPMGDAGQELASARSASTAALAHDSGGLKLKMAFLMDDVKSVRNLDEYYHHLPHYLAYYEDPILFRLQAPMGVLEYREQLVLAGEHLQMRQLDQDMLVTIGPHVCPIKSIQANQVVCEPPARIAPVYEAPAPSGGGGGAGSSGGRANQRPPTLRERALLPVVALIGSNLRYELGHMQYSSSQYLAPSGANGGDAPGAPTELAPPSPNYPQDFALDPFYSQAGPFASLGAAARPNPQDGPSTLSPAAALALGLLGLMVACLLAGLAFALARFRQTKAQQREYKRYQLQMGSLDCQSPGLNGASSFASGLFDKIYLPSMGLGGASSRAACAIGAQQQLFAAGQQQQQLQQQQQHQLRSADYASQLASGTKTKPLYQFFTGQPPQVPSSFPPSPLTDISSLVGSSPAHSQQQQQQQQQQHLVKLNASGQVVNVTSHQQQHACNYGPSLPQPPQQQQPQAGSSASPSHSSSGSSSSGGQRPPQRGPNSASARNFNWTQEAPSTIVPYAVIEACNLTLEGKNAIKEYV